MVVSLVEDLDPCVRTPFQLLNGNSGHWSALDGRCPHRLGPSSSYLASPLLNRTLSLPLLSYLASVRTTNKHALHGHTR